MLKLQRGTVSYCSVFPSPPVVLRLARVEVWRAVPSPKANPVLSAWWKAAMDRAHQASGTQPNRRGAEGHLELSAGDCKYSLSVQS